ncbi:hypothetical protein IL54_4564 [Sphingobium sp. ba1]|nr:hypothetical protein IL54_4564 [Sphingobium sp. ba1]
MPPHFPNAAQFRHIMPPLLFLPKSSPGRGGGRA